MKKCPYCAEEIQDEAIKCKHCDSILSVENNQISKNSNHKIKATSHPSYWTFTILGLLLPIVGIVVGIIYLTKENELDRKLGEHIIAISILGAILGYALYWMFNFHI